MSFWVMPPTPRWTKASFTSSRSSLRRLSVSASSEPVTSALRMRLSVAASPAWICSKMSSSRAPPVMACASRPRVADALPVLAGVGDLGGPSSRRGRPRSGRRRRRRRTGRAPATGVDGPASLTCSPLSSMSARTRPQAGTGDERVADLEGAALDEDGGDRAAADVEVGLEHDAAGRGRRGRPGGPRARPRRAAFSSRSSMPRFCSAETSTMIGVAAPRLGDEAVLGELLHDPVGVGVLAVDLVDRHDDRHLGRLGVVDAPRWSGA